VALTDGCCGGSGVVAFVVVVLHVVVVAVECYGESLAIVVHIVVLTNNLLEIFSRFKMRTYGLVLLTAAALSHPAAVIRCLSLRIISK
jgi:hypothetical protein